MRCDLHCNILSGQLIRSNMSWLGKEYNIYLTVIVGKNNACVQSLSQTECTHTHPLHFCQVLLCFCFLNPSLRSTFAKGLGQLNIILEHTMS